MTGAPATAPTNELPKRIVVGILLIAVTLAEVWLGEWPFAAFVALGGLLIFSEWSVMHRISRGWRLAGLVVVGVACMATQTGFALWAAPAIPVAALVLGLALRLTGGRGAVSLAAGIVYAGLPVVALLWLRLATDAALVIWILAIVAATDICAYFAGRLIGGPKILPAISPKKTWAGLIGGMCGAAAISAALAPQPVIPALGFALVGAGLAIVAQAGDFLESWLKRRAGVKDSGNILPGHGGVMDRVDGIIPVVVLVAAWLAVSDLML